MDPEYDDLQERITARLREKGPATMQTLASELGASQWKVQSSLERLQQEGSVRLLFGGLWDAHWKPPETKSVAEE
jgi:DNA-binding Lrp family transcriptional regulator